MENNSKDKSKFESVAISVNDEVNLTNDGIQNHNLNKKILKIVKILGLVFLISLAILYVFKYFEIEKLKHRIDVLESNNTEKWNEKDAVFKHRIDVLESNNTEKWNENYATFKHRIDVLESNTEKWNENYATFKYNITSLNFQISPTIENKKKKYYSYIELMRNHYLFDKNKYRKTNKPKVSILICVLNGEKTIKAAIRSIQNQSLKEIEILIVDDGSTDSTYNLLLAEQKNDNRIVIIKNEENKGLLKSRQIGLNESTGEYIQFLDCDDFLLEDILITSYEKCKANNLDFIDYSLISQVKDDIILSSRNSEEIVKQPDLSLIFKSKENLKQPSQSAINKLIKRETLIKAFNLIGKYLDVENNFHEGPYIVFALCKVADSYQYSKLEGYFTDRTIPNSDSKTAFNMKRREKSFLSSIYLVKFVYENSENSEIEKERVFFFFTNFLQFQIINNKLENAFGKSKELDELTNLLLKGKYNFTEEQKATIIKLNNNFNK